MRSAQARKRLALALEARAPARASDADAGVLRGPHVRSRLRARWVARCARSRDLDRGPALEALAERWCRPRVARSSSRAARWREMRDPLTRSSDPSRSMPAGTGGRLTRRAPRSLAATRAPPSRAAGTRDSARALSRADPLLEIRRGPRVALPGREGVEDSRDEPRARGPRAGSSWCVRGNRCPGRSRATIPCAGPARARARSRSPAARAAWARAISPRIWRWRWASAARACCCSTPISPRPASICCSDCTRGSTSSTCCRATRRSRRSWSKDRRACA